MTTDIRPWDTVIREVTLEITHREGAITEVLMTDSGVQEEAVEDKNVVDQNRFPLLFEFIHDYVVPEMLLYIETLWGYIPTNYRTVSWVRCTSDGSALEVHHHATPVLSSIYYLEGTSGELALLDPRGASERGLPSEIRKSKFGVYKHTPVDGKLVIFPSYLQHYVTAHKQSLRIAVPTDLYLIE